MALLGGVLFVCTFNRVRSPMAAGLMRRLYGDAAPIDSCGLILGEDVDPFAAAVMAEIGVDLSDHSPKRLADVVGQGRYGTIVALSQDAWLKVETADPAAIALCWPTADPTEGDGSRDTRLEAYRMVRRSLEARIVEQFGAPLAATGGR